MISQAIVSGDDETEIYILNLTHTHTHKTKTKTKNKKTKQKHKNKKIRLIYIKEKYFPHHKFYYKILQIDITINMINITSINNLCD